MRTSRCSNGMAYLALGNQEKQRSQQGHREVCRDTSKSPPVCQQLGRKRKQMAGVRAVGGLGN